MPERGMTEDGAWDSILGSPHGSTLRLALTLLHQVPADDLRRGLERIQHELATGPLFNPSAYVDGRRFRNAEEYTDLLRAALRLRELLPEAVEVAG